jgi:ApaG protein
VTLKTRYWKITDSTGRSQEVRGAGVVGEQPVLKPGQSFQYTSGAPLATPSGFMVGAYQMETDRGEAFNVDIPAFSLDGPQAPRHMH